MLGKKVVYLMIRALLVDDEKLAILVLTKQLLNILPDVEIVDSCTNPLQAIEQAKIHKPDVIFLDIVMPEVNGMQAAEMMQAASPQSDIVFVTGYDRYAIDAFEMNALDYVLKPVQAERLAKTMSRVTERMTLMKSKPDEPAGQMICCFKTLRPAYVPSGPSREAGQAQFRWRTTKAQELFAYLLHNRNQFVSKDLLIQEFWPDQDFKKASTYLYTTIYHIRKCLEQAGMPVEIVNASGGEGYTLHTLQVIVDVDRFEQGIRNLGEITEENYEEHYQLNQLYINDYLADHDYHWAEGERQRLRLLWLHHSMNLVQFYIQAGKVHEAINEYKRILGVHPYNEKTHLGLIGLYVDLGEHDAATAHYQEMKDLYWEELGITLPATFEEWSVEHAGIEPQKRSLKQA